MDGRRDGERGAKGAEIRLITSLSLLLLLATAALSFYIGQTLRTRATESPAARLMGLLASATSLWALFNAAELLSSNLWMIWVMTNVQYAAIAAVPVFWLQFGTQLLNRGEARVTGWRRWGVWTIPLITALLVWTDPWWGLMRNNLHVVERDGFSLLEKTFGPWFWVHVAYSYTLVVVGTWRVIRALNRETSHGAAQAWALGASACFPLGFNLLYLANLWPLPWIDPTPLAFTLSGLFFLLNLAQFRFLAVLPAALNTLVTGLDHAVLIVDLGGHLAYLNPAATTLLGLTSAEVGRSLVDLQARFAGLRGLPVAKGTHTAELSLTVGGEARAYEFHLVPIVQEGRPVASLYLGHDVTARTKSLEELEAMVAARTAELRSSHEKVSDELRRRIETEEQLVHLSLHDPLTGLSNRTLLSNRLELSLERFLRDPERLFVLLFIDFDHFKLVNDSYGHPAGDAFLRESAQRIQACVRTVDTVARLGGDEFVVLLDGVKNREEALEVADRIAADLSVPLRFGPHTIIPSASVGILPATAGYTNPEELLRDADLAMYHAKATGRNRRVEFDESMRALVQERTRINTDLRTAILEGQIEVYYQPIFRLSDRSVVGCEALARWNHPVLGPLSPERFIPIAEESGLIVPLGLLVLREAAKTAAQFKQRRPNQSVYTAVNVSALQLSQQGFDEVLVSYLDRLGLEARDVHLEITESALVQGAEAVQALLVGLVERGFQLKLDDFGTGYSSLAYLHRFPIQTIKIDQSFVRELGPTEGILKGIVSLGHELGKELVAEGIETEGQAEQLRAWGCDYGQGYLFSRPLTREAWLSFLD